MAYLTVLISLTQAIADNSLWQPLAKLTILDEKTCRKLETIVTLAIADNDGAPDSSAIGELK